MAGEEFLKFEITDEDLRSEFNPFRSRRRNKEEEIYGKYDNILPYCLISVALN